MIRIEQNERGFEDIYKLVGIGLPCMTVIFLSKRNVFVIPWARDSITTNTDESSSAVVAILR